jgi:prepilin-type N-terminal cleavage/methylation domain-containing protein
MQPANSRQPKTQKAFTLIELLVVIAIIGILAGMVVVNMSGATESARIAKLKVYSDSIRSSLMGNRVSEWKFNEGTGTSTVDSVGSNNGTLIGGPTWKSGSECVSGGCLSFDGSNDYVDVGDDQSLNIISAITMEAWIKPNSFGNGWRIIDKPYTSLAEPYSQYDLRLGEVTDGTNKASIDLSIGGTRKKLNTVSIMTAGNWYHLVGVYDGSSMKIYFNGALDNSISQTGSLTSYSTRTTIGGWKNTTAFFNGSIDEVRIYNAALTASAIRGQYLAGLDKLLAGGEITQKEYQEKLLELNLTYATSK